MSLNRNALSFRKSTILTVCLLFAVFFSCKKDDYGDSSDVLLVVTDSVKFDTVFTSQGSATRYFKIFNYDQQRLHLDLVRLAGGSASSFQVNVNGIAGTEFSNIDIDGGDSIYCFVRVNIDPTNAQNPFLVRDSIGIGYNGNTKYVQLLAYGQNAVYLDNPLITDDTTWTATLPIVLLKNITLPENKTLTIEKGTKIYCHAAAGLLVNGRLLANGDTAAVDRIQFTTDRLDEVDNVDYTKLAGAWPGLEFGAGSTGNILSYVTVQNAVHGIVDTLNASVPSTQKLALTGCIVQNNSGYAVLSRLGNLSVVNSLVANNGSGVGLYNGGQYSLIYNTLVGYGNLYVSHNMPSVIFNGSSSEPFQIVVRNCVLWGDNAALDNEIGVGTSSGTNTVIKIDHSLARYSSLPSLVQLSDMLQNIDPDFLLVDNDKVQYNFRLSVGSPCYGAAVTVDGIPYDLLGNKRNTLKPAIGCYENP
ncbi:MAG: hypothetical protein QM610_07840 [Chitinophagaceae bacterium]